jgi:hypothetical protein
MSPLIDCRPSTDASIDFGAELASPTVLADPLLVFNRMRREDPVHRSRALGAWLVTRFDGEVHTHYEDERWFGTRIKHRMKSNWLKMYDKFGLILRVETVINSPKEFWVYRTQ